MLNILTIKEMFYNTWIIKNNRRRESIYKFQFNYQTHEQNENRYKKCKKCRAKWASIARPWRYRPLKCIFTIYIDWKGLQWLFLAISLKTSRYVTERSDTGKRSKVADPHKPVLCHQRSLSPQAHWWVGVVKMTVDGILRCILKLWKRGYRLSGGYETILATSVDFSGKLL